MRRGSASEEVTQRETQQADSDEGSSERPGGVPHAALAPRACVLEVSKLAGIVPAGT